MTADDSGGTGPGTDDDIGEETDANQLPTVRVVVDFQPDRHLLFNVNDEQARALLERVHEERATAPDAQVHRLAFEFTAGQIEQTSEAFSRMADTDAADAALVDLTVTEEGAALPTLTVMLSMNEATATELAAGFADAVRRNDTGEWFVELPAVSMELLERALTAALDGASNPTADAMRQLRADR